MQPSITQFEAFEFTAAEPARKAFQPPVQFGAAASEPFVGRGGQRQFARKCRNLSRRQQITIEAAVMGGPLNPDVAGAKLVA